METSSDIRDKLLERLEARSSLQPEWKPETGEELFGEIVRGGMAKNQYGPYAYIVVRAEEDEKIVYARRAVLVNELRKQDLRIGDHILIAYDGKHPDKGYHLYRVEVLGSGIGPVIDIDWSKVTNNDDNRL